MPLQDLKLTRGHVLWITIAAMALLQGVATPTAQAQTFTVIHSFSAAPDGANPPVGLTLDPQGNLYGVTGGGGNLGGNCGSLGCGTVFKMRRAGSGWIMTPLYRFSGPDGLSPHGRLTFGPDGTLYGTTYAGQGDSCSCGNVFNLRPSPTRPATPFTPWLETVIHQFSPYGGDGFAPEGDVVFDHDGNLYGTTLVGGNDQCGGLGCGTVYELSPSAGGWIENVIYPLTGTGDGKEPADGPVLDLSGNLFVTSTEGEYDDNAQWGSVFELSPSASGWTESTLHTFQNGSGVVPEAGLIIDTAGNLYGATAATSGNGGGGTIYQLTPYGGGWSFENLYTFSGGGSGRTGPVARLLMDAAGNLYGTTYAVGAYGKGSVFKLSPGGGGWTLTTLHDFTGGSDGANPEGGLVMDANGNLFGTTFAGGKVSSNCQGTQYTCGVVFEISSQ